MAHESEFKLPTFVVGPADVSRLRREVETLSEYMRQAALRRRGEASAKLPRISRTLEQLAEANQLNLLAAREREHLRVALDNVLNHAPTISISFAADPSPAFTDKIVVWFRQNIHPLALLGIGLQPGLAGGCVLRTTNRHYDFSLRQDFARKRPLLLERLKGEDGVGQ